MLSNESHENDFVDPRQRQQAIAISVVMLLLTTVPIMQNFREQPDDGFPFSYYPMFTKKRSDETKLVHAVAVDSEGQATNLNYRYTNRGGMNQVRRQMRKTARIGKAQEMCNTVAKRVAKSDDALVDIVEVMIVEDYFDIQDFFEGDPEPTSRKVLAVSNVDRRRKK